MRFSLLLLGLLLPALATAQTCTTSWATAADGDWFDAANWTDGLPDATDTACIDAPGTYTVTTDGGFALPLAGLVVGGASGTQTLRTNADLDVSGDARITPNARVETFNRGSSNADGLDVAGTLLVEGVLAHGAFTRLMAAGGTLDVAPGGVLQYVQEQANAGFTDALFRIRGTLDVDCGASTCNLAASIDVQDGTIRVTSGRLDISGAGTIDDLVLDVAEGSTLHLRRGSAGSTFVVEGTVSGDPAGVVNWSQVDVAAGPAGATLAMGGTGFRLAGSVTPTLLTSAGGAFTNTGLLYRPTGFASNFSGISDVEVVNRGRIEFRDGLSMREGALLTNEADGVLAFVGDASSSVANDGRIVNRGLLLLDAGATQNASVSVPVDVEGGTVRVAAARRLTLEVGGTFRDATLEVAEGGTLWTRGTWLVEGTLGGEIAGEASAFSAFYQAGPADAVLDLGGNGLDIGEGSGTLFRFESAGGEFVNRGRLTARPNGPRFGVVVFRNEGDFVADGAGVTLETGSVFRNEPAGRFALERGANVSGPGRLENAGLVEALQGTSTNPTRSGFAGTLRSLPGSEIRTNAGAALDLDGPASRSLPADVRVTGDGQLYVFSLAYEIEGTLSPGTEEQPVDTLSVSSWLIFSRVAGRPELIVDVDAGGVGDQVALSRGAGPSFSARLGGTLIVRVRPGYTPQVGDSFEVIRLVNTQNDFDGAFSQVATVGGPAGIAFDAEVNAEGTALVVTAREAGSGPVTISPEQLVAGDLRRFILSGPGATGVTAARLECTTCADPDRLGMIGAAVATADGITTATADLSDPRAFGLYDLVLTTPGGEQRVPITVEPYVSILTVGAVGTSRVAIAPEGADTGWAAFRAEALTNGPQEIPYLVDLDLPEPFVRMALASYSHGAGPIYDRATAADPTEAQLFMVPGRDQYLSFSRQAGIDPDNIQFPGDEPRPNTVAFGEPIVFDFVSTDHMSTAAARAALAEALRTTPGALESYITSVDAADARAVDEATAATLRWNAGQIRDLPGLLAFVVADLDQTVSAPAGLAATAADAFGLRLKETTEAAGLEARMALREAYAASAELAAVIDAVFARLGTQIEAGASVLAGAGGASAPVSVQKRVRVRETLGCPGDDQNDAVRGFVNRKRAKLSYNLKDLTAPTAGGSSSNPNCDPPGGPFDPNDKTTETTLGCDLGFVEVDGEQVPRCVRYFLPRNRAAEPITYTIQFENLPEATAPATFVTITDVLDDDLNPSTLRVLQTSSDSTFSYTVSGQEVTFRFTDIDLPPNTTPPIGEGYVTFEVSPRGGLADGTEIVNSAGIVFDFNPPILTPEVVHELRPVADPVVTLSAPEELDTATPLVYTFTFENAGFDPAPDATLTITPAASDVQEVRSSSGTCEGTRPIVCDFGELPPGETVNVTVTQGPLPEGTTVLRGAASTSVFADTFFDNEAVAEVTVVAVGAEDDQGLPTAFALDGVYPNPLAARATVRYGLPEAASVEVVVYDLLGRRVAVLADEAQAAGWHRAEWDASHLASGVYVCQFRAGGVVQTRKVTVVR